MGFINKDNLFGLAFTIQIALVNPIYAVKEKSIKCDGSVS